MGNAPVTNTTSTGTIKKLPTTKISGEGILLWKAVPKEIKQIIFSKFELPQLMKLTRICKDWNVDIHEGLTRLTLREAHIKLISPQQLDALVAQCKNLSSLSLKQLSKENIRDYVRKFCLHARQITSLDLSFSNIDEKDLQIIAAFLPNLEELNLSHCTRIDFSKGLPHLWLLRNLRSLNLNCMLTYKPFYRYIETIVDLLSNFEHIRELHIKNWYITGYLCRIIAQSAPELQVLDVQCNSSMTHFTPSLKNLQNLEIIHLRFDEDEYKKENSTYLEAFWNFPKLRRVYIAFEQSEWTKYNLEIENWFVEFNKNRGRKTTLGMYSVPLAKTYDKNKLWRSQSIVKEPGLCSAYCFAERETN